MATTTSPPLQHAPPQPSPPQQASTDDPFDSLLTLEDDFYTEGYNQGMADGLVAGRTEGRQLGYERGFQKFVEAGRLQGRAIVWANRLRLQQQPRTGANVAPASSSPAVGTGTGDGDVSGGGGSEGSEGQGVAELPALPQNPRLVKHVSTLYALAETESLSTENTDEAVDDLDDRLRRAQGRAKIIERWVGVVVGEHNGVVSGLGHDPGASNGNGMGAGEGVDV
jgi:hypothetical protein